MVDSFWSTHYTFAETGVKIGTTRQNVYQRCLRGSIPCDRDEDGHPGVPIVWVDHTLTLRARDKEEK